MQLYNVYVHLATLPLWQQYNTQPAMHTLTTLTSVPSRGVQKVGIPMGPLGPMGIPWEWE